MRTSYSCRVISSSRMFRPFWSGRSIAWRVARAKRPKGSRVKGTKSATYGRRSCRRTRCGCSGSTRRRPRSWAKPAAREARLRTHRRNHRMIDHQESAVTITCKRNANAPLVGVLAVRLWGRLAGPFVDGDGSLSRGGARADARHSQVGAWRRGRVPPASERRRLSVSGRVPVVWRCLVTVARGALLRGRDEDEENRCGLFRLS